MISADPIATRTHPSSRTSSRRGLSFAKRVAAAHSLRMPSVLLGVVIFILCSRAEMHQLKHSCEAKTVSRDLSRPTSNSCKDPQFEPLRIPSVLLRLRAHSSLAAHSLSLVAGDSVHRLPPILKPQETSCLAETAGRIWMAVPSYRPHQHCSTRNSPQTVASEPDTRTRTHYVCASECVFACAPVE